MTLDLMLSKGLSTALVVLFFLAVVCLLRFLYGPRGRFRDPQWDKWNEEAREALEKEMNAREDARAREKFLSYSRSFFARDAARQANIRLKIDHTFRVCGHAAELIKREPALADAVTARALTLAALFHDVGRFAQYSEYGTFSDALSCNHGTLGARIVRDKGFVSAESQEVRRLVTGAVAAHNRLEIHRSVSGKFLIVLRALRDCDKLDILRVLIEHLAPGGKGDDAVLMHLEDRPDAWSPTVLRALEEGRCALYRDMRYYNDFRILLCTWLFDMHFAVSREIVRREGYMEQLVEGLSGAPEAQRKARALTEAFLAETSSPG